MENLDSCSHVRWADELSYTQTLGYETFLFLLHLNKRNVKKAL